MRLVIIILLAFIIISCNKNNNKEEVEIIIPDLFLMENEGIIKTKVISFEANNLIESKVFSNYQNFRFRLVDSLELDFVFEHNNIPLEFRESFNRELNYQIINETIDLNRRIYKSKNGYLFSQSIGFGMISLKIKSIKNTQINTNSYKKFSSIVNNLKIIDYEPKKIKFKTFREEEIIATNNDLKVIGISSQNQRNYFAVLNKSKFNSYSEIILKLWENSDIFKEYFKANDIICLYNTSEINSVLPSFQFIFISSFDANAEKGWCGNTSRKIGYDCIYKQK